MKYFPIMHFDLRSITETTENSKASKETMPKPGRVTEVCKEWLVFEDGALAYRLQNEEIEHHYMGNRVRNAMVRQDIPCAKEEQRREEQEAAHVQALYDKMIQEQEEMDAKVAQQLAEKIEHEEREKLVAHEQEDKELAHQYQERERRRFEKVQEKKRHTGVSKPEHMLDDNYTAQLPVRMPKGQLLNEATGFSGPTDVLAFSYEHSLVQDMRKSSLTEESGASSSRALDHTAIQNSSKTFDPLSDLSDFCLQPDPNMSEEEARLFQEEQDAELARLLQEQEMKRRGNSMVDRDRVIAVEAQDRELARMLQEKEKAKIKRARERARQRALMKKQQQLQLDTGEMGSTTGLSEDINDMDSGNRDSPPPLPSPGEWPEEPAALDDKKQSPVKGKGKQKCPQQPGTLMNIAMAIDPTYTQRSHSTTTQPLQTQVAGPLLNPGDISPPPDFEEEDLKGIPPYMPIQGQRRSASLEKKCKKSKGKKESKDSCKQQ